MVLTNVNILQKVKWVMFPDAAYYSKQNVILMLITHI